MLDIHNFVKNESTLRISQKLVAIYIYMKIFGINVFENNNIISNIEPVTRRRLKTDEGALSRRVRKRESRVESER